MCRASVMFTTFFRRLFHGRPQMLTPGTPAPDFRALDHHGREVTKGDFAGKRVVLWFYPKADTPG